MSVSILHFDRRKPFYPLVVNYLIGWWGWKELAARGFAVGGLPADDGSGLDPGARVVIERLRANPDLEVMPPLRLACQFHDESVAVPVELIAKDMAQNAPYLLMQHSRLAGGLLIQAHEVTKDELYHDTSPLWEFLRHCRNAAGHDGRFRFLNDEPRRPAQWKAVAIVKSLEGSPLLRGTDGNGLLLPGDLVHLLWDIEQECIP